MSTCLNIVVFNLLFIIGLGGIISTCESSSVGGRKNETKVESKATAAVPQGKILLNFLTEEDDLEERSGNKSVKILTRPLSPQMPTTTTRYYPNNMIYSHPNPGYYPGGGGDSYAQASALQPNTVQQQQQQHQHPTNNYNQQQQHQHPTNNYNQQHQQQQSSYHPQQAAAATQQGGAATSEGIPDIYVQLIGAIEKLVGRMDKIDTRLRTVENILYHMTNKKEELPEQGTCPNDFRAVEGIRGKCFKISSFTTKGTTAMLYDWKSAENECTKVGGRLVEMLNYEDFLRVSHFLIKYSTVSNSATSDFWIGGINPGLIWIWAESGQPVEMDKRFWNDNNNSSTAPGCLKLSYSHRLNTFFFRHSPCGHSQNYICEIMDNVVSRALARFEQQLWTDEKNSDEAMATLEKMAP